jgi:hypothetical protein
MTSSSSLAVERSQSLTADSVSIADSDTGSVDASHSTPCPTLAHSLKHDKSILSIAVSSKFVYAGTEGGEILVRSSPSNTFLARGSSINPSSRFSASRLSSKKAAQQHTKAASSVYSFLRMESFSSPVLLIDSSMWVIAVAPNFDLSLITPLGLGHSLP